MSATTTITATVEAITQTLPSLNLRASDVRYKNKDGKEDTYPYAHLLPTFPSTTYPPLEPYEFADPGLRALEHVNQTAFLDNATRVTQLTPRIGAEVEGVNLASLDDNARDELALYVARRGVVIFRDQQDFINRGPEFYKQWGQHFGRLHIHPTSGHPEGHPEFHLVYRDADHVFNVADRNSTTSVIWHSDVSYELQPPGTTTFFLVSQPETGGDTLFSSQVANLKALSPQFADFLRTLKVAHSGFEQAEFARSNRERAQVRREPVENIHPLVRRHPVTGEEAIYVNRGFSRRIVGLKREESDNILNFLYNHIAASSDNQARVKWSPNTVVLWDNRITAHTAIADFQESKERRHGIRITPQAERPAPASKDLVV